MVGFKSKGKTLNEMEPKCFDRKRKQTNKGKGEELDRQLENQQKGLNSMTVDDYLKGRSAFLGYNPCNPQQKVPKVKRDPKVAKKAREKETNERQVRKSDEFSMNRSLFAEKKQQYGVTESTVENKLKEFGMSSAAKKGRWSIDDKMLEVTAMADSRFEMKSLAALHNPDMVAGGKDKITGFGDRGVNSMIGGSWNSGKNSRVSELDKAACQESHKGNGSKNMNVKLTRCGQ